MNFSFAGSAPLRRSHSRVEISAIVRNPLTPMASPSRSFALRTVLFFATHRSVDGDSDRYMPLAAMNASGRSRLTAFAIAVISDNPRSSEPPSTACTICPPVVNAMISAFNPARFKNPLFTT